jgi:DNA-binding response OmpR family regulator
MTDKAHILLVDDDPLVFHLEKSLLGEDDYRYSTAQSGEDCLVRIEADRPDIILLDIMMPGMDGLKTCEFIRRGAHGQDIYTIFVSARNDAETRLAAYDAGGDDFMLKPLSAAEIRHKVEIALRTRQEVSDLRRNLSDTMNMAMTALSTSGEMGVILHFFSRSFSCQTMESLAGAILDGLGSYGLSASVQLKYEGGPLTLNSERRCSLIEQELLTSLAHDTRRIFDYGSRTVVNFPHVSVLIKNMPLDDEERYGRMKDNAALLIEGAEHRIQALANELAVRRRQQRLAAALRTAQGDLAEIRSEYKENHAEVAATLSTLERQVEASFSRLDMTESQESSLLAVVQPLSRKAYALEEKAMKNDERLSQVLDDLTGAITG